MAKFPKYVSVVTITNKKKTFFYAVFFAVEFWEFKRVIESTEYDDDRFKISVGLEQRNKEPNNFELFLFF